MARKFLTFDQVAFDTKADVEAYHQGWDMAKDTDREPKDEARRAGFLAYKRASEANRVFHAAMGL
jgi:hypothetical protein